MIFLINN